MNIPEEDQYSGRAIVYLAVTVVLAIGLSISILYLVAKMQGII